MAKPPESKMTKNWIGEKFLQECDKEVGFGRFRVSIAKSLTILLVGRSHTGKTTIINTLIDPQYSSWKLPYSDTREPKLHRLIVTETIEGVHKSYQLNIVDTPGLNEVRMSGQKALSDKELLDLSKLFLKENIARLDMVAMVTRGGDTHFEDIKVFREIINFLGDQFSDISMLILTHCDRFSNERITEFEKAIMTHDDTSDVYSYCKLGLWRVGALDKDFVNTLEDEVALARLVVLNKLKKNSEFRENFLSKVIELAEKENGLHVNSLNTVKNELDAIMKREREKGYNQAKEELKQEKNEIEKESEQGNCNIQ